MIESNGVDEKVYRPKCIINNMASPEENRRKTHSATRSNGSKRNIRKAEVILVSLDIKSAFDRAWQPKILEI